MNDRKITSPSTVPGSSLRSTAKEVAPDWLISLVRFCRTVRADIESRIAKVPGYHALWVVFYRLRFRLISPRTLNQKILYRMAYDRREILRSTTDKLGVRDYVNEHVDGKYLPMLYSSHEDAGCIAFEDLPRSYVMKATHASGATLLVDERAPQDSHLPTWDERRPYPFLARIHPDCVDQAEIRRLAATWLRNPYGRTSMRPQWAYEGLVPRVMFEELLDDGHGNVPPDYKVLCFNGEPTIVQLFSERERALQRAVYTSAWQRIHVDRTESLPSTEPPKLLPEMLSLSRRLAERFDFVRVDLYAVDDRLLVGELTHYPNGGNVIGGDRGPLSSAASRWSPSTPALRE